MLRDRYEPDPFFWAIIKLLAADPSLPKRRTAPKTHQHTHPMASRKSPTQDKTESCPARLAVPGELE